MELALQQKNTPYVINKIRLDFGAFLWSISFLPVMGYLGIKGHLDQNDKQLRKVPKVPCRQTIRPLSKNNMILVHDQQEFVEVLLLAKCLKMLHVEGNFQPGTEGWMIWMVEISKAPKASISVSKSLFCLLPLSVLMNCGTFLLTPNFQNLREFIPKDIVRTWLIGTTDHRIIGLATCQQAGVDLETGVI